MSHLEVSSPDLRSGQMVISSISLSLASMLPESTERPRPLSRVFWPPRQSVRAYQPPRIRMEGTKGAMGSESIKRFC